MPDIPIDWLNVDWLYVAVLAVLVFLSTIVAEVLAFSNRLLGAILSAVLFAAAFVFWTYYPHHLPLPTALTPPKAAVTTAPAPAAPAAPTRPRNPVTDVTPPASLPPATAPANPPAR